MSKQQNVSSHTQVRDYFNTDHLKADLKQRSVKGGIVTIAAQASKFAFKFGSTIVLARLLLPEDYGLIGMATVIIGFVEYFKDLGLSTATIQRREINHQQISTLFWINLGVGCLVALMVAGLAPAIASFYHEPRLKSITLALAINFVFGGLTVQHQALLRRQMQFTSLAKIEIIAMAMGVVTAILAAYYGLGYWALVVMLMVTAIVNAIGVWVACRWRPGLPRKDSEIGSMLAYGGNLTGFGLVNYFSRNLDNVLIGHRWGSSALGLYDQAYKLLLLPILQINGPINSVALPTLSSLQTEPEKYKKYYYKAILLISTLGMPIVAFMFACTEPLVLTLLGEQWSETILIFRCLAPAAFVGTINVAEGWVYQSLASTHRMFRWGIASSILNAIIFVWSVQGGIVHLAIAYSIYSMAIKPISLIYCYQKTPLKITELIKTIHRPAIASLGAAALVAMIEYWSIIQTQVLIDLLVYLILYGLSYLFIWLLLPGGRSILLDLVQMVKNLKKNKRSS
ncbi:lipopolysaccharide biosynthesis protein [Waterburya agarophytonicola K14]|uniref:Lipopolysaccharide biosynthesis protein n=1 Tax=Waterburya agarophytonicola KI4 TaxID=2874699 RepID=A0A964BT32_9CYAN|nr:lipopolysaccharide biosynthesis protein [Waterburya agarophytonicola KI4]